MACYVDIIFFLLLGFLGAGLYITALNVKYRDFRFITGYRQTG